MLDPNKLTETEKRVLLLSLNGYCNRSVSWLQQTGEWTAKQAAEVQVAEHMIDVLEESLNDYRISQLVTRVANFGVRRNLRSSEERAQRGQRPY